MTVYRSPVIVGSHAAPPDPSLLTSIGLHHSLPTAIADLVDNSIDADAVRVLIRILQSAGRAKGLLVIDDGKGMNGSAIDDAMRYAHKRDYEEHDLGHFGLGLKAASLSQADTLAVWSRSRGYLAVGRLIDRESVGREYRVSELDDAQAAERLDTAGAGFDLSTGTVVEWRDVRTFPSVADIAEQTSWLEQTIDDIQTHLGLVLHRILSDAKVTVEIDVFDLDEGEAGAPRTVTGIDPFGYPRSGNADYPQTLRMDIGGRSAMATAHIWPGRSSLPEFRLKGRPGRDHQGFYFYRNDRLLQVGGWNGVVNDRRDYELGRVVIDVDDVLAPHVTINPEKSGLVLDATLTQAVGSAPFDDGNGDFGDYLADLESGFRESRRRTRRPVSVIEPGVGFPGNVIMAFEESVEFKDSEAPIDLKWRALPEGTVFSVDREKRVLWLNLRYRTALVGYRSLDSDDAPVLKALFHLLMSRHFEGAYSGAYEKQELEAFQSILAAAVESRQRQQRWTSS